MFRSFSSTYMLHLFTTISICFIKCYCNLEKVESHFTQKLCLSLYLLNQPGFTLQARRRQPCGLATWAVPYRRVTEPLVKSSNTYDRTICQTRTDKSWRRISRTPKTVPFVWPPRRPAFSKDCPISYSLPASFWCQPHRPSTFTNHILNDSLYDELLGWWAEETMTITYSKGETKCHHKPGLSAVSESQSLFHGIFGKIISKWKAGKATIILLMKTCLNQFWHTLKLKLMLSLNGHRFLLECNLFCIFCFFAF